MKKPNTTSIKYCLQSIFEELIAPWLLIILRLILRFGRRLKEIKPREWIIALIITIIIWGGFLIWLIQTSTEYAKTLIAT